MNYQKDSAFTNEKTSFYGPAKRFIAIFTVIAASILFYGFVPSTGEETPLTSVTIVDGENYFEVETKGTTVGDALFAAGITLGENDSVSKETNAYLADNETITVTRERTIYLNTSGKTYKIKTRAKTVGEALLGDGFQLGKYDEVIPDASTPVKEGMTISVTRVYVDVVEVTEEIPFNETVIEDNTKYTVYKNVVQEGKNGKTVRTYKRITKEGAGVTAVLIGENVISEPVDRIVEVGTMEGFDPSAMSLTPGFTSDGIPHSAMPAMAQNNSRTIVNGNTAYTAYGTFTFSKVISSKATAYEGSAASNGKWAGTTATGRKPVYGIVAVDPKVIPLNSKLYIESSDGGSSWIYGFAIAGDTGGAIKGNRIDLCYHTLEQCYQFGRRNATVYVLD
ncbi:MAG: DUF348 domain-containing protein [Clostridia bacterium]|nr:DUF348 domain-containing protein [Clostridia bacterium]